MAMLMAMLMAVGYDRATPDMTALVTARTMLTRRQHRGAGRALRHHLH